MGRTCLEVARFMTLPVSSAIFASCTRGAGDGLR